VDAEHLPIRRLSLVDTRPAFQQRHGTRAAGESDGQKDGCEDDRRPSNDDKSRKHRADLPEN
jgi:hypothetical protein